ncbi:MAG TPA: MBL fold metallo-hydrolase [Methylomirabilota bacterium]|nr:MBL fold metallo-hydrolase [Methylomirabilota bacterium]
MRRSADAMSGGTTVTRVTIVGSGTSAPQPETPASGILVETATTAILIDCGQGVIREMTRIRDPRNLDAIVIGHLHADHFIDIVSLRYLLPWAGFTGRRVQILLPPGGRERMAELAAAISERVGFFDDALDVREYDPATDLTIGDLEVGFIPGRHYVPAWGCRLRDAAGRRIVVSGDTGPNDALVEAARDTDLFIVEATLLDSAEDDPVRGHLTIDEAIGIGRIARVGRTVLVHHRLRDHDALVSASLGSTGVAVGRPGLVIELDDVVRPVKADSAEPAGDLDDESGKPHTSSIGGPPSVARAG